MSRSTRGGMSLSRSNSPNRLGGSPDASPGRKSIFDGFESSAKGATESGIDPELIRARKTIQELKKEMAETKATSEKKIIELEKIKATLEIQRKEDKLKMEKLEIDRRFLFERDKETTSKLQSLTTESTKYKQTTDQTILSLRKERDALIEENSSLEEQLNEKESQYTFIVEEFEEKIEHLEGLLRETRQALRESVRAGKEKDEECALLQRQVLEAQAQVGEVRMRGGRGSAEDVATLNKQLHDQLKQIQSLESQNDQLTKSLRYYKSLYENIERLKEENLSLQKKLSLHDSLRNHAAQLESQLTSLLKEKARWTSFLDPRDETGIDSPYKLSKALAEKRFELAALREKSGSDAAKIRGMEARIGWLEEELEKVKGVARSAQEKSERDAKCLRRVEKSRGMAMKEVEFLREQLKSYDLEEVTLMGATFDRQKSERIEQLENLVSEYRSRVSELEEEISEMQRAAAAVAAAAGATKSGGEDAMTGVEAEGELFSPRVAEVLRKKDEVIAQLQKEAQMLKKEVESLDAQVGTLERSLGRGECDMANVR
ncbi:coiled-coil domain-containing protein mad1, partial [Quaeritorhiza haematococci]